MQINLTIIFNVLENLNINKTRVDGFDSLHFKDCFTKLYSAKYVGPANPEEITGVIK